ncbi:MAG: PAS domain S-box protein [Bacteroidales bacterium]|nr:PAS domain S-box protein [Bacteroidales bacterium]
MTNLPTEIKADPESLENNKELLQISEKKYQQLYNDIPLGFQSLDKNGNFINVNQIWINTLGYSREEVIGKWFGDFLIPGYIDQYKTIASHIKEAGEAHNLELEMVRKDGSSVFVTFDAKISYDETGHYQQTNCILIDVTKKKKIEIQGKEEQKKLELIFEAIPLGIMIIDEQKRIRMINKVGVSIMGFDTPEELYMHAVHEQFQKTEEQNDSLTNETEKMDHVEGILIHKSGKEIPIIKNDVPIFYCNEPMVLQTFVDITERKNATQDLFESRRQFTFLMDNLPGMVYRSLNDRSWTMEFVSDGSIDLTGYKPDELIKNKNLSYNDMIVPEDRQRVWDEVQEQVSKMRPFTQEYRIKTKDNKIKWVWEKGKGLFAEDGEVIHIEGFISDITEQKYAELIQKVLLDISKISYTAVSIDDVFKSIHSTLKQIIDVENFYIAIYDKKSDTISLPYQVDAKDNFAVFPAGKTVTGYVIKTRTPLLASEKIIEELAKKGHIDIIGTPAKVWLGVPLIVEEEVIGAIVVQSYTNPDQYTYREFEILKFVADQIAIVISRKHAEESFQKEKAYLDQLFESSSEAIVLIDLQGKVCKINSEFTSLFGYTREEITGQSIDKKIVAPEKIAEANEITLGVSSGQVTSIETLRRHKNGALIDVSLLVTPITIEGEIVGAYGIYRNITDRKRIENNLISAKEKAEESDKLKSAFLSNMSHEIRTPMNAILGFSTLLSDPGVSEEEKKEFIHIIKDRGNDLMRIIDDIIDVAKIESGQIKVEIKEFQVNVLMNNLLVTLNEVKRKTGKTHIALNCLPENRDMDFTILTDGNRLRQILTNLIENALKFTHQGSVEFGYILKTIEDDSFIEFFVRDTGIGIPQKMHDVIFERFRQVDDTNTRVYGGTGLGLTISKNLIRLLGGQIHLESESGKGTTFKVLLPIKMITGKSFEQTKKAPIDSEFHDWSKKTILVVEDEDSNFFLLDRILKRTKATMVWAKNGMDAIDTCNKQPIDLVLMDIRMPIMDGYEATDLIKKDHPSLPIIAQTAYALKGEAEKSLTAGCDNYIAKPIDSKSLLNLLAKYLEI